MRPLPRYTGPHLPTTRVPSSVAGWAYSAAAGMLGATLILATTVVHVPGAASDASAQQVPLHRFDVRDGLAHSRVTQIAQDSLGFLWFATWEGVSRYDGYRFRNFAPAEGLDPPLVFDMARDGTGSLWVGLWGGGIARLQDGDPAAPNERNRVERFRQHLVGGKRHENLVFDLAFDAADSVWCLTEAGTYRAATRGMDSLHFAPVSTPMPISAILATRDRRLWCGMGGRLVEYAAGRFLPELLPGDDDFRSRGLGNRDPRDGNSHTADSREEDSSGTEGRGEHSRHEGLPDAHLSPIIEILEAPDGSLLVLQRLAAHVYRPSAHGSRSASRGAGSWETVPVPLIPGADIRAAAFDGEGRLWIGTTRGLLRETPDGWRSYGVREGLGDGFVRCLFFDREGSLWIGTNQTGVLRFSGERIVRFIASDASDSGEAVKVIEGSNGVLVASIVTGGLVRIDPRDPVARPVPEPGPSSPIDYRIVQDDRGDWWIGTTSGLVRYEGPDLVDASGRAAPRAPVGSDAPDGHILGLYFDERRAELWASTADGRIVHGARSRSSDLFVWTEVAAPPALEGPRTILRLRNGDVWIAAFVGLVRLREGIGESIQLPFSVAGSQPRALYEDRAGRLWIGLRFGGLLVTEDPAADVPVFRTFGASDGLASQTIWSVTEDDAGRIYLGTGRGLNRLDPVTGAFEHFTTADGLAGETVNSCARSRDGRIWLGTSGGVSRFDPRIAPPEWVPPPVYIASAEIGGEPLPMIAAGRRRLAGLSVPPGRNSLSAEFVGVTFRDRDRLRYEYTLEGADAGWTAPMAERSVRYARLEPGRYRLLVRAVTPDGRRTPVPAEIAFEVLRPFWQQAWFVALAAVALASATLGLHRMRLRQAIALERIRRQIALDLHDEVGSGLSEIAVLTEVVRREIAGEASTRLGRTADVARRLRESMSDIVWSVDPRRDSVIDLVRRMRQTAVNLFDADETEMRFDAPPETAIGAIALAPDRRRHLLLLFKEAATNVARHARATRVAIRIAIEGDTLVVSMQDDGVGFDPAVPVEGNGLRSVRERAALLGAALSVAAAPGAGTRISARVPLRSLRLRLLRPRLHRPGLHKPRLFRRRGTPEPPHDHAVGGAQAGLEEFGNP